jgi:hypothetical protein
MVSLALAYGAILLVIVLRADSGAWAISLLPTLLLVPLIYVLHRGSLGWIEIHEQEIEVVPSWFGRQLWGQQSKTSRFDSGSELLFCRRFAYSALDGFFIILRSRSRPDQTLWSTAANSSGVSRRWWSRITQEISHAHDLKTRLIEQKVSTQGMLETDWPSGRDKMAWKALTLLIFPAVAPYLGIGARLLTADAIKLMLSGALLWVCVGAWIWYWLRPLEGKRPPDLVSRMLIFTLQFATFYTLAVLVTGAVLHH